MSESEYLQSQEEWFYDEVIVVDVKVKGGRCLVSFSRTPERKVRKRLRDFKFKWDERRETWVGAAAAKDKIIEYINKNTDYDVW